MIPKIIHQIWFQEKTHQKLCIDNLSVPLKIKKNIREIIKLNSEYKYYLWNKEKIINLIKNYYPKYYQLYLDCKYMIQRIDLAKYLIIYHYGGIYIDIDCKPIKSFDNFFSKFNDHKLLFVSKTPRFNNLENYFVKLVYDFKTDNYFINNGIIISPKNHHFLKYLLNRIDTYFYKNNDKLYISKIFNTFGPSTFTNLILEHKNDIMILDNKYFEPCYGKDITCKISEETILLHQHQSFWIKNNQYSNNILNFIINNFFDVISNSLSCYYFTLIRGYKLLYFIILIIILINNNKFNL